VEIGIWGVVKGAFVAHDKRSMARPGGQRGPEQVAVQVDVVGEHAGGVDGERDVLRRDVAVVVGLRRAAGRSQADVDTDGGGAGRCLAVADLVGERVDALEAAIGLVDEQSFGVHGQLPVAGKRQQQGGEGVAVRVRVVGQQVGPELLVAAHRVGVVQGHRRRVRRLVELVHDRGRGIRLALPSAAERGDGQQLAELKGLEREPPWAQPAVPRAGRRAGAHPFQVVSRREHDLDLHANVVGKCIGRSDASSTCTAVLRVVNKPGFGGPRSVCERQTAGSEAHGRSERRTKTADAVGVRQVAFQAVRGRRESPAAAGLPWRPAQGSLRGGSPKAASRLDFDPPSAAVDFFPFFSRVCDACARN